MSNTQFRDHQRCGANKTKRWVGWMEGIKIALFFRR